jgi:uncharacterized Zn-binding protein involved in type VI secretion
MKRLRVVSLPVQALGLLLIAAPALAQDGGGHPAPAPGVTVEGSGNVSAGGQPAARMGDRTDDGHAVAEGSSNVFINGRPAVRVGDKTNCGGVVVGGASNVFVNGRPLARAGDLTSGCPGK